MTDVTLKSLDAFHRRQLRSLQLRSLLGIKWPETISNAALYRRCCSEPISDVIRRLRWQLFGHILRLDEDTPARMAMAKYFDGRNQTRWRGRPRTTLPTVLATDLRNAGQGNLQTKNDLERLLTLANNRCLWRELCLCVCPA